MPETHQPGDILKYNTLWKLGHHFCFEFFKVSHVTAKGSVMGWRLASKSRVEETDGQTFSRKVWIVDTESSGKSVLRLPHPASWDKVTSEEVSNGVRATSCVS